MPDPLSSIIGENVPGITQPMASNHFAVSFEFFKETPLKLSNVLSVTGNFQNIVNNVNVKRTILSNLYDFRFSQVSGIGFTKTTTALSPKQETPQNNSPLGTTFNALKLSRALLTLSPLSQWAEEWKNRETVSPSFNAMGPQPPAVVPEGVTPPTPAELAAAAERAVREADAELQKKLVKTKANVMVLLLGKRHLPIMGWQFLNAWPSSYSIGPLDAMTEGYVKEEITLTYESYETVDLRDIVSAYKEVRGQLNGLSDQINNIFQTY